MELDLKSSPNQTKLVSKILPCEGTLVLVQIEGYLHTTNDGTQKLSVRMSGISADPSLI